MNDIDIDIDINIDIDVYRYMYEKKLQATEMLSVNGRIK